jgi:hypothetical protein
MACTPNTISGVTLDCGQTGGLAAIYIAHKEDVASVTITAGEVASITMESNKKFKKFDFRKKNAKYDVSGTTTDENGTVFYTTVTEAKFNKMETAKRTEMTAVAKGATYVIAVDTNGLEWLIGYDTQEDTYNMSSVTGSTGSAFGDANQYILTLTAETREMPYQIKADFDLSTIVA